MKYAGHIKRQQFLKTILEGKIEGMRGGGPQRFKWKDNNKGKRWWWRFTAANLHSGDGA